MADDNSKIDDAARALAQALCLPSRANRDAIRLALAGAASAGRHDGWRACCKEFRSYDNDFIDEVVGDVEAKAPGEAE